MTLDRALVLAKQHQAAGRLAEARAVFERMLGVGWHHPTVLTMLASIAYQEGDDTQGDAYADRALAIYAAAYDADRIDPAHLGAFANLLLARGRAAEAERLMPEVELALNPIRLSPEAFERRRQAAEAAGLPPMLIITMPKSASESIWNRLAEGLGLAQSHVSIGLFPECCLVPHRVRLFARGGMIAKEHLGPTPHNLSVLQAHGIDRLIVHVRDPRQATLSWAHFVRSDVSRRLLAPLWRRVVPPARVLERDLEATIDWCLEHYLPLLVDFIENWMALAREPVLGLQVRCLSFERFRIAPEDYFDEVLAFYSIERARFALDTPAEVTHLRKGALEEWRDVFNRGQRRRASAAIPMMLAQAFDWRL